MATLYFYKELFSIPYLVNGAPAPFEQLDGNRGVLVVDDAQNPPLAKALSEAATKRKGGVIRITQEAFEDVKKKWPFDSSALNSRKEMLRVFNPNHKKPPALPPTPTQPSAASAVVVVAPGDSPKPSLPANPIPQYKPPTQKVKQAELDKPKPSAPTKD